MSVELVPVVGAPMPEGPVVLGIAVFTAGGELMGAARCPAPPAWLWRDGRLCVAYGEVRVVMRRRGWYAYGVICAMPAVITGAAPAGGVVQLPLVPLWRIGLGESHELRAGDDMHVLDGLVAIVPGGEPGWADPLR